MRFQRILNNILSQKAKIKILRYLVLQTKEQSGRAIARGAAVNHWQCNKILKELHQEGILTMRQFSNTYLYGLKRDRYIVKKLIVPLFNREKSLIENLTLELRKLKFRGIISVILFGSLAKGKEKPHSDIDVLIIVDDKEDKRVIEQKIESRNEYFLKYYGNSISPYIISKSKFKKRYADGDKLLRNIVKTGRYIFGKTIGEIIIS